MLQNASSFVACFIGYLKCLIQFQSSFTVEKIIVVTMPGESETLGEELLYIHLKLSWWHLQRKTEDKAKETSVKCLFNI
jgi:hypothetical protein